MITRWGEYEWLCEIEEIIVPKQVEQVMTTYL